MDTIKYKTKNVDVQVFYTTLHFLEIFTAHSALLHCAVRTLVDFSNSAKSQLDHMQQSYQCNCSAKCAGVLKPVSRATYFRHAKYRPLQGIFDERLAEVIQGNSTTASSVDCNATLGQPSSKKSVKRRRVEEDSDSEESVKNTTLLMEDHPPDFAPHDYDHSDGIQEDENTFQGRDNTPALSIVNEDEDTLPEEHEANIPQPYHDHDPPHDNNVGLDDKDLAELSRLARLDDIKDAMIFIEALRSATLDNGLISFDPDALERLRNPPQEVLSIDDPDVLLSLKLFLADTTEAAYNSIRNAIMDRFPNSEVLSYYQVRRRVALLSGIQPIVHDMCIDSCVAFCGPWQHHDKCPKC
ncbi:hypothetical protein EDD22DRAFT_1050425, partial [Suillus occidentalis]